MTTVDFFVHAQRLFTMTPKYVFRAISRGSDKIDIGGRELVLFSSPFYENLEKLMIQPQAFDTSDYTDEEIAQIREMMSRNLEERVVECSLTNSNQLIPFRLRDDKPYPNGGMVAYTNIAACFAPPNDNDVYFEPIVADAEMKMYHDCSHAMRGYVAKAIARVAAEHRIEYVMDLCGGRGGDYSFLPKSMEHLFVVDADKNALTRYADKIWRENEREKLPTMNAIPGILSNDNQEILRDIHSRLEYDGFDLVLMNFAIHYLCDDAGKIDALVEMLRQVCGSRRNTLLAITYHDGEILRDHVDIRSQDDASGVTIASVPLPTIDASGYREEPLALRRFIDRIPFQQLLCEKVIDHVESIRKMQSKMPRYGFMLDSIRLIVYILPPAITY
jgi:hypothetical protein